MVTFGQLLDFFRTWAGLSAPEISASLRGIREARIPLPSRRPDTATLDQAIWLLLAILIAPDRRVRDVAHMPNSRQSLNGLVVNEGDFAITVFDGLRDVINLRRSGAVAT